jgi:tetratricopeptide (TPR) repeat protein
LREERADMAVPRLLLLLMTVGMLVGIAVAWNPISPVCVALIGALVTVAVARGSGFLFAAALTAFSVRLVLSVGLHWLAALDVPALRGLQTAAVGGYRFWILAPDSRGYHDLAERLLVAWRQGTEFPPLLDYGILTAVAYLMFGANPLNMVLWNALFGALAVVTGYRMAERLGGASAARLGAILIALWPSAVLWSTQLLKDAMSLWLILVMLYVTMLLADPTPVPRSRGQRVARWVGLALLLFVAAMVTHRLRFYVLQILIPTPLVFIAYALIRRTRQSAFRVVAASAVIAIMVLAGVASRRIDLKGTLEPGHPEVAHLNLGVLYQSRGDHDQAREHYERARTVVHPAEYAPALKGLASVALARNDPANAVVYFERYLAREPGDVEARRALDAVRRAMPKVAAPTPARPVAPAPAAAPAAVNALERPEMAGVSSASARENREKDPNVSRETVRSAAFEVSGDILSPEAVPPSAPVGTTEEARKPPMKSGRAEGKSAPPDHERAREVTTKPAQPDASPLPQVTPRETVHSGAFEVSGDILWPEAVPPSAPLRTTEEARKPPMKSGLAEVKSAPPGRERAREVTTKPAQPDSTPLPQVTPTEIAVPPTSFAITGPGSDHVTGGRAWRYADPFKALRQLRKGFTSTGGYSSVDVDVQFDSYRDVLRYLPRALAHVFLAPYPWQWFDIKGDAGPFRALSVFEALLLYACLGPLVVGLWAGIVRGSPDTVFLAVFVITSAVLMGLVVSNIGSLFRIRLELLLPLFTVAGVGWASLVRRWGAFSTPAAGTAAGGHRRESAE